MIREILQHPNDTLRQRSAEILITNEAERDHAVAVIRDLLDTFNAHAIAIGLAAPQVGHLHRVIVVDITRQAVDRYLMINPVIVKQTPQMQRVQDGCMSVERGHLHASTKRPLGITVEWIGPDGRERKQKFRGLIAAVIHHEVDHLDGKLFIDQAARAA